MKLSELVSKQAEWESERGIQNGRYNLERIRVELDEAMVADKPEDVLEELIDVFIIASGGLAKACNELGLDFGEVDRVLEAKLATNSQKYNLSFFSGSDPLEAQKRARHWWEVGDPWEGTDVY